MVHQITEPSGFELYNSENIRIVQIADNYIRLTVLTPQISIAILAELDSAIAQVLNKASNKQIIIATAITPNPQPVDPMQIMASMKNYLTYLNHPNLEVLFFSTGSNGTYNVFAMLQALLKNLTSMFDKVVLFRSVEDLMEKLTVQGHKYIPDDLVNHLPTYLPDHPNAPHSEV